MKFRGGKYIYVLKLDVRRRFRYSFTGKVVNRNKRNSSERLYLKKVHTKQLFLTPKHNPNNWIRVSKFLFGYPICGLNDDPQHFDQLFSFVFFLSFFQRRRISRWEGAQLQGSESCRCERKEERIQGGSVMSQSSNHTRQWEHNGGQEKNINKHSSKRTFHTLYQPLTMHLLNVQMIFNSWLSHRHN